MKNHFLTLACSLATLTAAAISSFATQPEVLFEDDFNRGLPGWTAVQPTATYIDGPMRWQYDVVSGAFVEQSNIYTGAPGGSTNATAVMLINDASTEGDFTYTARLVAGDDDAFGLIFGYQDANDFYRVTFSRQDRTAEPAPTFPYTSWLVDRMVDGEPENLFGWPTDGYVETFRNTQYQPFDVTLTIENGLFSLTVIDDPEGLQIPHQLVVNEPLPGSADGQVGLMSWGMGGTAVRGFRIFDPTLTPGGFERGHRNGIRKSPETTAFAPTKIVIVLDADDDLPHIPDDANNSPDPINNHGATGWNWGFADGHAEWVTAAKTSDMLYESWMLSGVGTKPYGQR